MVEPAGHVVLADDDESVHRWVRPVFAPSFSVASAYNVPQGHAAFDAAPLLSLAIVDLEMPGGRPFDLRRGLGGGFELARRVTSEFAPATAVVLTAYSSPAIVNAAQRQGVELIVKEDYLPNLALLRDRIAARLSPATARRRRFLRSFARQHGLPLRQAQALSLAVAGQTYRQIATRMAIGQSTVKFHIRCVLAKTGYESVKAIVASESQTDELDGDDPPA